MIVMCVTSLLTAISCLLWWETNRIYVEIFSRDVDAFQTIVVPNKKLVLILLFLKKKISTCIEHNESELCAYYLGKKLLGEKNK